MCEWGCLVLNLGLTYYYFMGYPGTDEQNVYSELICFEYNSWLISNIFVLKSVSVSSLRRGTTCRGHKHICVADNVRDGGLCARVCVCNGMSRHRRHRRADTASRRRNTVLIYRHI